MFEMDLLSYEVLLAGELLHTQVDGLLQLADFLLELLNLLSEDANGLLVLLVLLENTGQLLLLNHDLVEDGCVVDQISTLKLCVPLEVFVLLHGGLDAGAQSVGLAVELVKEIGFGGQVFDAFLETCAFAVVVLEFSIVGLLLVIEEYECPLNVFVLGPFSLSKIGEGLLLHMVEHLLIKFLKTGPQFFILLPDLIFVHFVVVRKFGHVLVALGVGELRVGDGWQ